jgi:dihydropyrimidinase
MGGGARSPSLDLVVEGGELVTDAGVQRADIGIAEGRVALLGAPGTLPLAAETIDARGRHILPGLVDGHVHVALSLGEFTTRDGFAEASGAAAFGGTTTIIDFAIPLSHETPATALERRMEESAGQCYVDYSFHPTVARSVSPEILDQVPVLIEQGFPTFKAFTVYRDLVMVEPGDVLRLMRTLRQHGGLVLVHAETASIIERSIEEYVAAGLTGPQYHAPSRPPIAEVDAIRTVIGFVELTGCPAYIVHMSTAEGPQLLAQARAAGLPIYGETCPQYLLLDECVYAEPDGERFICSPPVRGKMDRDALWRGLRANWLHMVNTDHCCYDTAQKALHRDRFPAVPNGLPGIETRLRLLLTEGLHAGRLTLPRIVELASTNPARLLGLYPRKGTIAIGSDADLVLVDLDREGTIRAADLHMATDYTPYEGRPVKGEVVTTISRGRVVVSEGRLLGDPGHGVLLRRILDPADFPA